MLQTALAPAASASPCGPGVCGTGAVGQCPQCGPGAGTCTTNAECTTGLCVGSVCVLPYGSTVPCTSGAQCQSGNCTGGLCRSWPGTTCATDQECLSGKCVGGRCFENTLGAACRGTADCTDNTTCGPTKVCGGADALCQNDNKCVSGDCQRGRCVGP